MHAVIIEDLEEYLSGSLPPTALHRFEAHLDACGQCREEVARMQESAGLFASLKDAGPAVPPPHFVAQVMQNVAARPALAFWNPLRDFAFGRQVVFASLLTMAVLGTVLVSREEAYAPEPPTPAALIADGGSAPNTDQMLVTLSSYEP